MIANVAILSLKKGKMMKKTGKTVFIAVVKAVIAAIAAIATMWTVSTQPKAVCIAIAVCVNALMIYDLETSKRTKSLAQMHTGVDRIDIHPRLH